MSVHPAPCPVLQNILETGLVEKPNGERIRNVANISVENSAALYHTVRDQAPETVVEIGMAQGVSTLSILAALAENGKGRLISIDPYIGWPTGMSTALHQISRARRSDRHRHMHECSYTALPRLMDEGIIPDLVYIDGNHNFDYAFTDFFLADKLIRPGGLMGFNDAGWRSVFRIIRFLKKYRHYQELNVGLPRVFPSRNLLFSVVKRLQGRSKFDRYFEKVDDWEPDGACLQISGP